MKDLRARIGARSRSTANKVHKWLSAAFMGGIEHGGLTTTPMLALKRPFAEPKRKRHLPDEEIALIWCVFPCIDWRFAAIERFLILLGQRLREVAGMRWNEIDLDRVEWIIPSSRTKNKREHLAPLAPLLVCMLVAIEPRPEAREGLVFTTTSRTPVSGFSKSKTEIDAAVEEAIAAEGWLALQVRS